MPQRLNIQLGAKYNKLTILKEVEPYTGNKKYKVNVRRFLCLCDCGNETISRMSDVITGLKKSCGCQKIESAKLGLSGLRHGKYGTPLYRKWRSMIQRCYGDTESNYKCYKNYGGRGIRVCDEWKNNFLLFEKWAIKSGYKKGLSLDRINNDGDYSPFNCRWATTKQQNRNTRKNTPITYDGVLYPSLADLCDKFNLRYSRINERLRVLGWSVKDAVTL